MDANAIFKAPETSKRTVLLVSGCAGTIAVLAAITGLIATLFVPHDKSTPPPAVQHGQYGERRSPSLEDYQPAKKAPPEWVSRGITPARVILSVFAMILAGSAVSLRPRWCASWLLAGGVCFVSSVGFPQSWDSFRMVALAFGGLAMAGGFLAALSLRWRIAVASAAVIYHFVGIFNSIIKPYPAPELATSVWNAVFRPYNEFAYLVNAYQFYSPNPGPASHLWFCIDYENLIEDPVQFEQLRQNLNGEPIRDARGSLVYEPMKDSDGDLTGQPIFDREGNSIFAPKLDRYGNVVQRPTLDADGRHVYLKFAAWFKAPRRPEQYKDPLGQSYYRRLSLTENASQTSQISNANYEILRVRRIQHGDPEIPFNNNDQRYFRWPTDDVMSRTLPAYVRHVAHELRRADRKIRGIKVYRVEHEVVEPRLFVAGQSRPYDPSTYLPYYMGDFSVDGKLRNKNDPMLYFLIPILPNPNVPPERFAGRDVRHLTMTSYRELFVDYVEKHAGCSHMKGELSR